MVPEKYLFDFFEPCDVMQFAWRNMAQKSQIGIFPEPYKLVNCFSF